MRHFIVCALVSTLLPGIGSMICHLGGVWYENNYPSIDAKEDLKNNKLGILIGTPIGIIIWLLITGMV